MLRNVAKNKRKLVYFIEYIMQNRLTSNFNFNKKKK